MKGLGKLEELERRRIQEAMAKAEPGSEEHAKLLKAREQLEDISAKRRAGSIKPADVLKLCVSFGTTLCVVTSDIWIPTVASKLKLQDMVSKFLK